MGGAVNESGLRTVRKRLLDGVTDWPKLAYICVQDFTRNASTMRPPSCARPCPWHVRSPPCHGTRVCTRTASQYEPLWRQGGPTGASPAPFSSSASLPNRISFFFAFREPVPEPVVFGFFAGGGCSAVVTPPRRSIRLRVVCGKRPAHADSVRHAVFAAGRQPQPPTGRQSVPVAPAEQAWGV